MHRLDHLVAYRRLGAALAASLIAHGLLLVLLPEPAVSTGAHGAMTARLHARPAANQPAVPVAEEPVREALERRYDTPAPSAGASSGRWPEAMMHAPEDIASDVAGTMMIDRGLFIDGLRQYHAALSSSIGNFRRYPPEARQERREGRIALRLKIASGGTPESIALIGSSGHASLDRAALELLRLAASHTPVPESLRGMDFAIDLAVDYNLSDSSP